MTEPTESTKIEISQKIANLTVAGGGFYAIFCLVNDDIVKAIVGGTITFFLSLITKFWESFSNTIHSHADRAGEIAGNRTVKAFSKMLSSLTSWSTNFSKLYEDALKTYCYSFEIEGFQNLPGLPLKEIFVPLRIKSQNLIPSEFNQEIWDFLPHDNKKFPYRRIAIVG